MENHMVHAQMGFMRMTGHPTKSSAWGMLIFRRIPLGRISVSFIQNWLVFAMAP
jgi:hypothetical protein